MIIDDSRNTLGENPQVVIIIGGVASCAMIMVTALAVMCCLSLRRSSKTSRSIQFRKCMNCHQVDCTCNSSNTVATSAVSDTIKSVQVNSNPAYTSSSELLGNKDDKADNLYTAVDELNDDNFEYMGIDIEQEIIAVTSPKTTSPTLISPPSAIPAPALLAKAVNSEDQSHVSDEDEDGYVTYNPKKPPFEAHQHLENDSNQIYENTMSTSLPAPGRRHGYVNDVQRLVEEIEAEKKDNELERCDSYCNIDHLQAKIDEVQLEELDQGLYVNNLDALVQAAKMLEDSQEVKPRAATSTGKEPVDHRSYVNDLFLSVQQTLKDERSSKRQAQEPEDMYENSISYSKPPHTHW